MELHRQKRPFYSKVRTGCLTCKIRKVKCDEGKPRCHRCTSTGRHCEGYRTPPTHASRSVSRLSSASPPASLSSQSGLFASPAERRSFYYFQSHACKPLAGYFDSSFWSRQIIQAAIHYEPIRHLVIALGSAYESFEGEPGGTASPTTHGTLSHRRKTTLRTSSHGMDFALEQCNTAIGQLAKFTDRSQSSYEAAEATSCVLTASILFIYFAAVRSHMAEAIQHIQSAVRVLRYFDESQSTDDGQSPNVSTPTFPVPISQLRAVLTCAYGQVRVMSNDVFLQDRVIGGKDMLVSDIKPATIFLSVPEAHLYVEILFHNTQAFLQETELHPPSPNDKLGLDRVVARHKELCQALDSSWKALDNLSTSLTLSSGGGSDSSQDNDKNGIVVLRLYHLLLAVRLRIDIFRPEKRELAFDELESHLEEMLELCEVLVGNEKRASREGKAEAATPLCSSGLGYVMPLHTIAARCRNPRVRRRALELLMTSSRRDGIWDSKLAGSIASKTLAMEEEWGDETVPREDRRVREVKIVLQGEKRAQLKFITVSDWKRGHDGTQKFIEW
ncbi:hypothetical protein GE09DRAFT_1211486 [Coniochaeta sp. 2T2.1]|nr:hypothetical protein GE09DRAFT_1211486 [Coniochaeta sp. 2T2.1]